MKTKYTKPDPDDKLDHNVVVNVYNIVKHHMNETNFEMEIRPTKNLGYSQDHYSPIKMNESLSDFDKYNKIIDNIGITFIREADEYNSITTSASYFDVKDFHIIYNTFNCYLSDFSYTMIDSMESTLDGVKQLNNLMEELNNNPKYEDVDMMSPKARSTDSDNYCFIVGFNLA
jgi:hypothetical protein